MSCLNEGLKYRKTLDRLKKEAKVINDRKGDYEAPPLHTYARSVYNRWAKKGIHTIEEFKDFLNNPTGNVKKRDILSWKSRIVYYTEIFEFVKEDDKDLSQGKRKCFTCMELLTFDKFQKHKGDVPKGFICIECKEKFAKIKRDIKE